MSFKLELESRTKQFSINLINFLKSFPFNGIDQIIAKQILRSGTSIGANYREANRAESKKDFIHNIGIVEKEAFEIQYWFELIKSTWKMNKEQSENFQTLYQESKEFTALFSTISRKSKT
jgi:four helix bundle protein